MLASSAVHQFQPPILTKFTQLTSLYCGSLAFIPQLSPLKQLQVLHLLNHSAASLSVPELAMISELPSLRRLCFSQRRTERSDRARCLKVGLGASPVPDKHLPRHTRGTMPSKARVTLA